MEANIALPASLIGDPARAAILASLVDGRAQPAGVLAHAAGISAQSASNHLSKLLEGGLLSLEIQGRHRYYRLSSTQVGAALEALAQLAPPIRSMDKRISKSAVHLCFARTCYDHLAGRLGVAVATTIQDKGYILVREDDPTQLLVSKDGERWFSSIGLDITNLKPGTRGLAHRCLDWTERRHHLAGPVASALLSRFLELDWLRRVDETRAVKLTDKGMTAMRDHLGLGAGHLGIHYRS